MNIADIVFVILLMTGAYFGYKKGLFQEILTFFALILALVTAFKLTDTGIKFISSYFEIKTVLLPYVSFIFIFFLVFVLIILFGKTLENIIQKTLLGSFDKAAGAALGLVKFAFSVSVVLWLTHVSGLNLGMKYFSDSLLYPYLLHFAPNTFDLISHVIPFQNIFSSIHDSMKL